MQSFNKGAKALIKARLDRTIQVEDQKEGREGKEKRKSRGFNFSQVPAVIECVNVLNPDPNLHSDQ